MNVTTWLNSFNNIASQQTYQYTHIIRTLHTLCRSKTILQFATECCNFH